MCRFAITVSETKDHVVPIGPIFKIDSKVKLFGSYECCVTSEFYDFVVGY